MGRRSAGGCGVVVDGGDGDSDLSVSDGDLSVSDGGGGDGFWSVLSRLNIQQIQYLEISRLEEIIQHIPPSMLKHLK